MPLQNDFNVQSDLQHELLNDEKILWAGKPMTGIKFNSNDIFVIPFTIIWFSFALFWEFGASSSGGIFFTLWGIPFVLVGFYMVVGRFFYDKWRRANTVYGVTTNRIIIKSTLLKSNVQSFNIAILFTLSIEEKSDGSGTINLDSDNQPNGRFNATGLPGSKTAPKIEFIEQVRSVYNLILQQQQLINKKACYIDGKKQSQRGFTQ